MRTHILLYFLSALIFIFMMFLPSNTINISSHDTYFVIDFRFILIFFVLLFGFFGLISFLLRKKKMNQILFWIHWLGSISLPIVLILMNHNDSEQRQYEDYSVYDEFNSSSFDYNQLLTFLVILFILCQIVFLINSIAKAVRKS